VTLLVYVECVLFEVNQVVVFTVSWLLFFFLLWFDRYLTCS